MNQSWRSARTATPHLARLLVACYPRAWRDRYGDEMSELLGAHRVTWWTLLDLLAGALDAHLHAGLVPGRMISVLQRLRSSELLIFCAFIAFGIPWLGLQRLPDPLQFWNPAVASHPEVGLSFLIARLAGQVAFLAVLAGGLPVVFVALRQALRTRQGAVLRPFALATGALVVIVVATGILALTRPAMSDMRVVAIAGLIWLIIFFAGLVVATLAAVVGATRSEPDGRLLRYALWPARVVVVAMLVTLLAVVAITLQIQTAVPSLFASQDVGLFLLEMAIVAMALTTGLAAVSLWRGLQVRGADPAQAA